MSEIKLAVDSRPSLRIDGVFVRRLAARRSHRTVAVVLRRVAVRILDKHFAVRAISKAPAQLVPQIFEFALTLDGFPVGEISDRIVAADRQFGLVAPRGGYEDESEQQSEKRRGVL